VGLVRDVLPAAVLEEVGSPADTTIFRWPPAYTGSWGRFDTAEMTFLLLQWVAAYAAEL